MFLSKKGQAKIDEFAFVLLAGLVLIIVMMVAFSTVPAVAFQVIPQCTENKTCEILFTDSNPSISLKIPANSANSIILNLNGTASNISLAAAGEIKTWVRFSKNDFDVSGTELVTALISVPSSALERVYTGSIIVSFSGGSKTIPVEVNTTKTPVLELSHPFLFGDFPVSYALGTDVLAEKNDFEVSRGYFSDYAVNLVPDSIPDQQFSIVTGGFISIVVDDTNGVGNLIVDFNGQEVYNQRPGPTEILIPIDKSQIRQANTVTIRADIPGWMFWMSTVYKIRSAKFGISFQGIFSVDKIFDLSENEVNNLEYVQLSFFARNQVSDARNLIVKLNDITVFDDVPTLYPHKFIKVLEPSTVNLNVGANMISFSTEPSGDYSLEDVTLTVVYTD